ncbi:hypothetical protein BCT12_01495 [Vibrio breoganii]|nr:hypothetical protein BCT12_01495 [Vibrio breoganii]
MIGFQVLMSYLTQKQKLYRLLGYNTIYENYYDKREAIFVHIPKTAGTSICHSLYGGISWPWHFNSQQCQKISPQKFEKYYKFTFVRDPVERLISTFNYAQTHISKNKGGSSIKFLLDYDDFNDFVQSWLTKENIAKHYFFATQKSYVYSDEGELMVDQVYYFSEIEDGFLDLSEKLGVKLVLEKRNISQSKKVSPIIISNESMEIIKDVYSDDYNYFNFK